MNVSTGGKLVLKVDGREAGYTTPIRQEVKSRSTGNSDRLEIVKRKVTAALFARGCGFFMPQNRFNYLRVGKIR